MGVVLLQLFWIPVPFKDIGCWKFEKSPFLKLTLYLSYFEYDCHTVTMLAMFWVWLQYCSHVFYILSIITILFACLLCFEHDCHTVAMFNPFWLRLPHFGHICHIISIIAILWSCLPYFEHDCRTFSRGLTLALNTLLTESYIQCIINNSRGLWPSHSYPHLRPTLTELLLWC